MRIDFELMKQMIIEKRQWSAPELELKIMRAREALAISSDEEAICFIWLACGYNEPYPEVG